MIGIGLMCVNGCPSGRFIVRISFSNKNLGSYYTGKVGQDVLPGEKEQSHICKLTV